MCKQEFNCIVNTLILSIDEVISQMDDFNIDTKFEIRSLIDHLDDADKITNTHLKDAIHQLEKVCKYVKDELPELNNYLKMASNSKQEEETN